MFEVGRRYEIRMIESGEEISRYGVVELYEHPLLKLQDATFPAGSIYMPQGATLRGPIINTTSPNFISATIIDPRPELDE